MNKNVILVAGYEYHHGRTNIANICKNRANHIIHQHPDWSSELVFLLFDVKEGKIQRGVDNGDTIRWTDQSSGFEPINDNTHYNSERHFIQQSTNVLSITDAYEFIQDLGVDEENSVYEFSVFGHGWRGGPVLVNSFERDEFNSGARRLERDPWDKDGRRKDTNTTNMDFTQWMNFIKAFANNAHIWVWGCAASRLYKNVIQKVVASSEFGEKRYGSHLDTDTFNLSFSQSFADRYFSYDPLFFFRSASVQAITSRRFSRTLREVKDFLIRGICNTYAGQMAYNTQIEVYAALPGTGADYERGGSSSRRVMVVPKNSGVYGYSYAHVLRFYKTYLSIHEDPESRGYAVYSPRAIANWKA